MIPLIKKSGLQADLHLSTQMNTLNHLSLNFWQEQGLKRVVLGREVTLSEIKKISTQTKIELEVFCHGALCIAYSGRCLLSRYLTGRNANEGDCSQPCRWNYSLIETKRPGHYLDIIEHGPSTEIISSKDLCLIEKLDEYKKAGVQAFKIEGRMKSLYYTANTTRIYKHALTTTDSKARENFLPFWIKELDLVSHRPYTTNLFKEFDNLKFENIPYIKKVLFMGYKYSSGLKKNEAYLKTFNPLYPGEELEAIFPIKNDNLKDKNIKVETVYDEAGYLIPFAQPGKKCLVKFSSSLDDEAILRKRLKD